MAKPAVDPAAQSAEHLRVIRGLLGAFFIAIVLVVAVLVIANGTKARQPSGADYNSCIAGGRTPDDCLFHP